jgi:hypothetical protein
MRGATPQFHHSHSRGVTVDKDSFVHRTSAAYLNLNLFISGNKTAATRSLTNLSHLYLNYCKLDGAREANFI